MAADEDIVKLKKYLSILFPTDEIQSISETPISGLFEVDFGDSFIYITADGSHVVKGDIINVLTNVNLTNVKRDRARLKTLEIIPEKEMIVYAAKNKLTTLTVFTDIDCTYCRRLHNEMQAYNELGIEIRYMFYPRAGVGSHSYQKATSVWCAEDQRKALDLAKRGRGIEHRECTTPIIKHVEIANRLGVNSTPTLLFSDGAMLPGYIPPARLALILKQRKLIP